MKIVVLDGYTANPGDLSWDKIKAFGELECYDRTPPEETLKRIGDAEIVITNKVVLSREIIEKCKNLKFITLLATGYNTIDIEAAKEHGIPVSNAPSYSTSSVAQFVFALLLEICHHVQKHSDSVMAGKWSKSLYTSYWDFPLIELSDMTLGIIGFGQIGRTVASIAVSFGMKVLVYSSHYHPEYESENIMYTDKDSLFRSSDVISLHCPLFPSTRNIIDSGAIEKMKDGVIIINTSRGALVNEEDMRKALDSGKVGWFAADVVSAEPMSKDNPLIGAKNLFITPHIAWAPLAARKRLIDLTANNISAYLRGKPVNVVNP